MKKTNKVIGYSLSIVAIVFGVLIFGAGIYSLLNWITNGFFYLIAGCFLVVLGKIQIKDMKSEDIIED